MATGASTADLTIVLIDVPGRAYSSSRAVYAYIASLLGIPRVAVAVNKMDLIEFREEVFCGIEHDFIEFARDPRISRSALLSRSAR